MKCPFRTKIVYKPKTTYTDGTIKTYKEKIVDFEECYEKECPYFLRITTQECSRINNKREV